MYSANIKPHPSEVGLDLRVWKRAGFRNMVADRKNREFEIGHLHISKAFDLSDHFKWIFHIATPLFMGGSYYEEDILCECYKTCLKKVDELKLDSIAFPVLASGFLNFNLYDAFDIAQEAIDEITPKLRKMAAMITAYELDNPELRADALTEGEVILANYDAVRKEIEKDNAFLRWTYQSSMIIRYLSCLTIYTDLWICMQYDKCNRSVIRKKRLRIIVTSYAIENIIKVSAIVLQFAIQCDIIVSERWSILWQQELQM